MAYELVHTLGNSKPSSRLDLLKQEKNVEALKVRMIMYGIIKDLEAQEEDLFAI